MSATRWLLFRLADGTYAVPVTAVAEVLRMAALTALPGAPAWLPGMLNLRGHVIPVVDLRVRLGLPAPRPGLDTPIIVATHDGRSYGFIADALLDVVDLPEEALEPQSLAVRTYPGLAGMARLADRLVILIDLGGLCNDELLAIS